MTCSSPWKWEHCVFLPGQGERGVFFSVSFCPHSSESTEGWTWGCSPNLPHPIQQTLLYDPSEILGLSVTAAEPGQFWLIRMCLSFQATSQLAFSEAYLDLAPILCILSQPLWTHLCNFHAVSRRHHFHCLWLLPSFCPLFCDDSWALGGGSVMWTSHEEVSSSFFSTHWPVGVFVWTTVCCKRESHFQVDFTSFFAAQIWGTLRGYTETLHVWNPRSSLRPYL